MGEIEVGGKIVGHFYDDVTKDISKTESEEYRKNIEKWYTEMFHERSSSEESFFLGYRIKAEDLISKPEFNFNFHSEWLKDMLKRFSKRVELLPKPEFNSPVIVLKIDPKNFDIEEFKREWNETVNKVIEFPKDSVVEFIQPQRIHCLHNHPALEIRFGVPDDKVIVDAEFINKFETCSLKTEDGLRGHIIVSKEEYLKLITKK